MGATTCSMATVAALWASFDGRHRDDIVIAVCLGGVLWFPAAGNGSSVCCRLLTAPLASPSPPPRHEFDLGRL